MTVERFLHTIDGISTWVGKAAAWLIIALMAVVCLEVFKRYMLNAPTAWIFDLNNMLYGSLFMLCGAYALAQNAHVRGDFLYSSMRPRTQAPLDLVLYFVFFFPGIGALVYAGCDYAGDSWRIGEHSNVTADGPPVYHFKTVIPVAGALVLLQGVAEVVRCIVCLRTGAWPPRLKDVARSTSSRSSSRTASTSTTTCASWRSPRRSRSTRRRGSAAWAETTRYERSRTRAPDAGAHRGRDHDGLRHRLHPDGAGHLLRLHRLLRSRRSRGRDNKVFDLMVQRTYGAMTNDVLISIPLFVLMGYVMERGALVDKMFYSIQLAFRRVPAALAVATLIVCTFWGIASGLVGAVVVLMGVIAFNPMLRAGYDVKLASGVITAGGTLGILIPPSVMIIVYAAVAGQSVVKLYAAAMFPGFFLALLYLVYIIGWALINPKIAPKLPEEQTRVPVPGWVERSRRPIRATCWSASPRRCSRPARAARDRGRRQAARLPRAAAAISAWRWCRCAGRGHPGRRVVVRRHPPAGAAKRAEVAGLQQLGTRRHRDGARDRGRAGPSTAFYHLVRRHRRAAGAGAGALLLAHGRGALRGAEAADRLGDAARHPDRDRAGA